MGLFRRRQHNSGPNKEDDVSSVEKSQTKPDMMIDQTDFGEDVVIEADNNNNNLRRRPRRSLRNLLGGGRGGGRRSSSHNERPQDEDFADEDQDDDDGFVKEEILGSVSGFVPPPPTVPTKGPSTFRPSYLQSKVTESSNESKSMVEPTPGGRGAALPPPAREAAFHGPPRFDWIDIEFAAATKIQSIHRRNKAMRELEERGLTTSAIRNRRRRRKVAQRSYFGGGTGTTTTTSSSTSSLFNCCGLGLLFGDDGDYSKDEAAYRAFQRKQYEERVKQQQAHEDALRKKYMKDNNIEEPTAMLEKVEVVK